METTPRQLGASRLTGWKEIAANLGKTVRTVQRWERELGLPVRRIGSGRGETVYAFVEELDRWLETSHGARAPNHAGKADDAGKAPEGAEQPDGASFDADSSSSQRKRLEQASAPSQPRRRMLAAALVAA
ncbi:MAG TPA: hypothetical protein VK911_09315, partial [Vicinamibacterales bacterium]|nr:hypothetical protein [Vicinamibacterales bacterium]